MTLEEAQQLTKGTPVRCTEYDLVATFDRVPSPHRGDDAEAEVTYAEGGFDFWPLVSTEVIA